MGKILYKSGCIREKNKIKKDIKKALGENISTYFDEAFYTVDESQKEYQKLNQPYLILEQKINALVENKKISLATGESIKFRNKINIDY
ncbi:hypothetical protein SDC9_150217 [bioreactor metagenome]|uniref:Uncharacterized protein n=1 Tax=bioreactor metagenome TaxID=1076179 RepID=A0A645EQV9_9ZZZZ